MYTIQSFSEFTDKTHALRHFDVQFSDGSDTFVKRFSFSLGTNDVSIKKTVDSFLSKLNADNPEIADFVPPVIEQTADEIARDAWLAQWDRYLSAQRAMKALADAEIQPTEEEVTRFNALKTWVADNRKPEYAEYI